MKIGYRTIKTAIGAPIAIWIAQLLQLENYASAAILTILCIQVTRKRSVLSAWSRLVACILAILFSFVFFEVLGYDPYVFGLLLLLFIPATVKLKVTEGIVSSTVIILHLFNFGAIGMQEILNEVLIILVGLGTALIMNLYMPSLENNLQKIQKKVEDNFSIVLKEIANFLRNGDLSWTGKELTETSKLLDQAMNVAFHDVENHMLRRNTYSYFYYFKMRIKQFEHLERMVPLVSRISNTYEQNHDMADFFETLGKAVHPGNTASIFLDKLHVLKENFRNQDLPITRNEFETRANLFALLGEIEQYLLIKNSFVYDVPSENKKRKFAKT
ncbi:aromatic acid exporter family protein [Bacillaceae bacterium S4-13-58]